MKSTNYSEKVLDHFKKPRNVGVLEGPDVAKGTVGNPTCGDIMEMSIKVVNDVIEDIKFQTFGCGSAVATSSMTTVMVKGMTLDEALRVTRKDVASELDGLPPIKMHCSNLAADALHEAIKNYRAGEIGVFPETKNKEDSNETGSTNFKGEMEYLGKGLSYTISDYNDFKDKRVLILYSNSESIEQAIELTKFTGRVILLTKNKTFPKETPLRKELLQSDVKVLYESELLEVMGEGEVEKVKILNLDEEETLELFIDALIVFQGIKINPECEDLD